MSKKKYLSLLIYPMNCGLKQSIWTHGFIKIFTMFPIIFLIGWFLSCENPFTSKPSKENNTLKISHNFDGRTKLIEATPITLTWSRITFSLFEKYIIYRSILVENQEIWIERTQITDPLQVTYTDSLDDDQTYRYRVRMFDSNGNFQEATTDPIIIRTTSITVPDEIECLQNAYDSPFIDDGDTLFVNPPTICTVPTPLRFINKDVYIKSVLGKEETMLSHLKRTLIMNRGVLSGFTIKQGTVNLYGTALLKDCIITQVFTSGTTAPVELSENAQLENCLISGNQNLTLLGSGGDGGGIMLHDQATIINSQITGNLATRRGGGIFVDGEPRIINSIIDHNYADEEGGGLYLDLGAKLTIINSVLYGNKTGGSGQYGAVKIEKHASLEMLNSIVWDNSSISGETNPWKNTSYSDIQRGITGTGNINIPPLFVDPENGDFHLQSNSPCIDAGHPGDEYRDVDGSRNDMGAYGGPNGEW